MQRWLVSSGGIREIVQADDQFKAWDTLRDRGIGEFGLIAKAEAAEDAEPYLVRTSLLMRRWGRIANSQLFVDAMMKEGMPDTTEADKEAAANFFA